MSHLSYGSQYKDPKGKPVKNPLRQSSKSEDRVICMLFFVILAFLVWMFTRSAERAREQYLRSPYHVETNNILFQV